MGHDDPRTTSIHTVAYAEDLCAALSDAGEPGSRLPVARKEVTTSTLARRADDPGAWPSGGTMVRMFVRHDVDDGGRWRLGFGDFDSLKAASSFAGAQEFKDATQNACVTCAAQIWFTDAA